MRNIFSSNVFHWFLLFISYGTVAQPASGEMSRLLREDSVDINTISAYPENVRENIFIVASHPEGVVKLMDIQKNSNDAFRKEVSGFTREEQQAVWNLTRYPNLVSKLAGTRGNKNRVEEVLKAYPADIHDDAYKYGTERPELLAALHAINQDFSVSFDKIVAGYPPNDQAAFRQLLDAPEALSLLGDNMRLTVLLGDLYKTDPVSLKASVDSLGLLNAEQKARDAEAWKEEMNKNPEAKNEIKQSAVEYAKEAGYTEKDYSGTSPQVVERYVFLPYPYWSGYPYWHEYPFWYPYPLWYQWGFYFWHDDVIWLGPPSWYFVHWHFHHHPHLYHYPHLTNVFINRYYYGPRRGISSNAVEVHRWMNDNARSLPADFRTNTGERVERIREYGKSEIERDRFNRENPDRKVSHDEFIRVHAEEYPHLKRDAASETPDELKQPAGEPVRTGTGEERKDPAGDTKKERTDSKTGYPDRNEKDIIDRPDGKTKPVKITIPDKPGAPVIKPENKKSIPEIPQTKPSRIPVPTEKKQSPAEKKPSEQERKK
jgi:hypothetical protein